MSERTERLTFDVTLSEELLEKIQKLFALTESPNENEAQVASNMAMKLLAKHNLSVEEFNLQYKVKSDEVVEEDLPLPISQVWRAGLLNVIAPNCFCASFRQKKTVKVPTDIPGYETEKEKTVLTIVGSHVNRQVAIELFNYLSEILPRICDLEMKKSTSPFSPGTDGVWRTAFNNAFIKRVGERLEAQRLEITREHANDVTSIVRYDPYEEAQNRIQQYYGEQGYTFIRAKSTSSSKGDAATLGRQAGSNVSLNPARQLGS